MLNTGLLNFFFKLCAMDEIRFWKDWPPAHRVILFSGLATLCLAVIYLFAGYVGGSSATTSWEVRYAQHTTETEITSFSIGEFQFTVPADLYLTYAYFQGSAIQPRSLAGSIFIMGLMLSITLVVAIVTTLPRFWFFAGMGLLIVFVITLRLEVLYLFEVHGRTVPVILLALLIALAFYFNVLRPQTSLLTRVVVIAACIAGVMVLIALYAGVTYPGFHMAVTGYWPALIISLIFFLMIAHEIPASFVYLTGQAGGGTRNALHFTVIMLLYILYLFILYFDEVGIVSLHLSEISVYLLLIISTVLGLWGFRQREHLYENIFPFNPVGALLYVALAAIALFTTGFLLSSYNDAALKVIREVILFSHLGYGIIFFTYVVSNFMAVMARNLPAHKILYKPNRMPYFTFRLAGLIATLAFVFYMNWKEYVYHAMGGYYNNLGDLHQLLDKPAMAEVFYLQVKSYAFQNNRANYQLAVTEARRFNREQAAYLYELANAKRPTVYSLVNHGNLYARTGSWFEAIRLYRKGLEKFDDPHLALNLGYAYAQVHKTDSALYFFEQARKTKSTKGMAESNFLALIGQEYIPVQVDSVIAGLTNSSALQANALVLAAQRRQQSEIIPDDFPDNTPLEVATATLLHNYLITRVGRHDTAFLHKVLQLAADSVNEDYSEALKAALAYAHYYQLQPAKALDLLSEISFTSLSYEGRYQYLAGLWTLEQQAPEQAVHHFERASATGYKDATQYLAIAQAEAGFKEGALQAARSLLQHADSAVRQLGSRLVHVLTVQPDRLTNDADRYLFCRYRIQVNDAALFEQVLKQFINPNYRALALLDMSSRQLRAGNTKQSADYAGRISGLPVSDYGVLQKIRQHQLLLYATTGDVTALKESLTSDLPFSGFAKQQLMLYRALLAEHAGDTAQATVLFSQLSRDNPFFEEGMLEAVHYFSRQGIDDMIIYNLLADAIHRNRYSYRLLRIYAEVASRLGFNTYARGAIERADALKKRM